MIVHIPRCRVLTRIRIGTAFFQGRIKRCAQIRPAFGSRPRKSPAQGSATVTRTYTGSNSRPLQSITYAAMPPRVTCSSDSRGCPCQAQRGRQHLSERYQQQRASQQRHQPHLAGAGHQRPEKRQQKGQGQDNSPARSSYQRNRNGTQQLSEHRFGDWPARMPARSRRIRRCAEPGKSSAARHPAARNARPAEQRAAFGRLHQRD